LEFSAGGKAAAGRWLSAPMRRVLIGADSFVPGISTTGSDCWPEEDAWLGGRTPAKPRWSEVMIFFGVFLRREGCCPEVVVSSDEKILAQTRS